MKINNKTAKELKKDFPIFKNHKGLVYLDNAATSQKPKKVIDSIVDFYEKSNANVHRGVYSLSEEAMKKYDGARKVVADFVNAKEKEIVFTRNATESINLLSYTIDSLISKGRNEIVLTEMEHHSNLIPWQQLAKRKKMKLKFISVKDDFTLDIEDAKKKITNKTAILSFLQISNVLGTINPAKELIKMGKEKGALTIIDAAQSVSHMKVDVKNLSCDFLVFSSHKMLGPTGVGVLYGKKKWLEKMRPFNFGGGMIKSVTSENAEWADVPEKFEAGTQNIGEVVGLSEAIIYLKKLGLDNIEKWEKELMKYALEKIGAIEDIKVYNPGIKKSLSTVSFNLKNIHPHDVASLLDDDKIAIRAGHHCAMPLMKKLGIRGTCRASFCFYNSFEDIDKLVKSLKKINKRFKK
jgi:cysteine desulfurase/selenocysteine lyase|tara:strand:+ start:912 stop:2135 length:1224 start_codon:yes stop_codon:yes gene_type:complete